MPSSYLFSTWKSIRLLLLTFITVPPSLQPRDLLPAPPRFRLLRTRVLAYLFLFQALHLASAMHSCLLNKGFSSLCSVLPLRGLLGPVHDECNCTHHPNNPYRAATKQYVLLATIRWSTTYKFTGWAQDSTQRACDPGVFEASASA